MDTYWLTCKEGGPIRTVEMETPTYLQVLYSTYFKSKLFYLIIFHVYRMKIRNQFL